VPDGYYEHDEAVSLNTADNAVVTDAIPPKASLIANQSFAKSSRTLV